MRIIIRIALIVILLTTETCFSQVTYTWVGGSSGNFTTAANWSPMRLNGQVSDILCFNSGVTVNALNIQQQTIGQLLITNSTHVIFTPASGNPKCISINGGTGDDFVVQDGSTFEISGNTPILGFFLKTGTTGSINGTVIIGGSSAHYINAQDANSLVFHSGSSCIQLTPGAVFTNSGTPNVIIFEDGSSFFLNSIQALSPFGLTTPNSKVHFSQNSTYIMQQPNASALKLNGRTYGNLTLNYSTSIQVNDTLSNNVLFNNITINAGSSLSINNVNSTYIPTLVIGGNLVVNGSINFTNNQAFIVHFNGSNNQIVSGNGTISLPTTLVFSNLYLNNCKLIANTIVSGEGSINSNNGYIIGTLTKHFSSMVTTQNFEVGTANGYSPVTITLNNVISSGADMGYYSLTVSAVSSVHPMVPDSTNAMRRYWSILNNGLQTEDYSATFHYLLCDFNNPNFTSLQNESSMLDESYKNINEHENQQQNVMLRDTVNHKIGITGVIAFGDFTNIKNTQGVSGNQLFNPNKAPDNTNSLKFNIPSQFGISQNYPNPFNPTTKIDYQLPLACKVSIILYDLTGREVTKLVNSNQSAGNYTVQVNGMNLSSGVYFYKIDASNGSQRFEKALKMILTK